MSFTIRSSTIRLGIFISSLVIAAILIFQLVWLKKIYRFEQKEFDHSIVKAIRGLYEDLDIKDLQCQSRLINLLKTPKPNLYLAHITLPGKPGFSHQLICNTNSKILAFSRLSIWVSTGRLIKIYLYRFTNCPGNKI